MGLPFKITAQGSAVRSTNAPQARALDCDLERQKNLGTVGRATRTDRLTAVPETA